MTRWLTRLLDSLLTPPERFDGRCRFCLGYHGGDDFAAHPERRRP